MTTAIEVTRADRLTPDQRGAVLELVRTAEAADGTPPLSDGASGLRVVRVLNALQEELDASRRAAPA